MSGFNIPPLGRRGLYSIRFPWAPFGVFGSYSPLQYNFTQKLLCNESAGEGYGLALYLGGVARERKD